jgi:hypothetical protein
MKNSNSFAQCLHHSWIDINLHSCREAHCCFLYAQHGLCPVQRSCAAPGGSYSSLANFANGFDIEVTAKNANEAPVPLCLKSQVVGGTCKTPEVTWEKGASVTVNFTLPLPTSKELFLNGKKPVKYRVFLCFSDPDQVGRKWRKFADPFKVLPHTFLCFMKCHLFREKRLFNESLMFYFLLLLLCRSCNHDSLHAITLLLIDLNDSVVCRARIDDDLLHRLLL